MIIDWYDSTRNYIGEVQFMIEAASIFKWRAAGAYNIQKDVFIFAPDKSSEGRGIQGTHTIWNSPRS
jgi:hypothetical protein